ncbi:LOW QUALITY PROTEIN: hypothetical protein N665_0076s0307 [Sinapis alba]|nr:LOW QUALITY PROTEIN: hypothetical protein N665_0076s0307 [Sinapis alba]
MELKQQEYSLSRKRSSDQKSLGSSSFTDEVIIIDDDDEVKETLEENKNKKQRVGPWWDESDAFKELPKLKDDHASVVGSSSLQKSKAKKYERALSLIQRGNFFDLCDDESLNDGNNKTMQDPLLGRYKNKENISHVDDCFTFCSINDLIKDPKKGNEIIGESSGSSNKGNQHVSLEELGVSVEDLKSMPWEAFEPKWSETMDPWLGGYAKDIISSAD